jgi:hypothetical protein
VRRALAALAGCGLASWARRIVRDGLAVRQTSSAYVLTVGNPPSFPTVRTDCQNGTGTRKRVFPTVQQVAFEVREVDRTDALKALATIAADRTAALAATWARKGLGNKSALAPA